jgi:hypothetical protein
VAFISRALKLETKVLNMHHFHHLYFYEPKTNSQISLSAPHLISAPPDVVFLEKNSFFTISIVRMGAIVKS